MRACGRRSRLHEDADLESEQLLGLPLTPNEGLVWTGWPRRPGRRLVCYPLGLASGRRDADELDTEHESVSGIGIAVTAGGIGLHGRGSRNR